MMDARQLFDAYRFEDAVIAYKDQLAKGVNDEWANLDGLSKALIASGHYAEAIPHLEIVGQYQRSLLPGAPGREIQLSICHWVLGDRELALKVIRDLVIAVRDRVITYADLAGGVSQGIILCYMGATLQRQDDVKLALKFLIDRARSRKITSWPGPAALLLLGKTTFEESVRNATGVAELGRARATAEANLLKRRQLTNVLFAAAVERRLASDEAQCRMYMASCASLTNPLLEYEWHLAKQEAAQ
jgi:hypothetical protein